MSERILTLYEWRELVAVYEDSDAGRAALAADRHHLLAQSRADWESRAMRVTREYRDPPMEVGFAEVRTTPRYASGIDTESAFAPIDDVMQALESLLTRDEKPDDD